MATLVLLALGLSGCASGHHSAGSLERFQGLSGLFRQLSESNATVSRDTQSLQRALLAGARSCILGASTKTGRDGSRLARISSRLLARLALLHGAVAARSVRHYFDLVTQSVSEQHSEAVNVHHAMRLLRVDTFLLDARNAVLFAREYTAASQSAHRAVVLAGTAMEWKNRHARAFRFIPADSTATTTS